MVGAESPRWVTGPAAYLRFHGGAKGHLGHYGDEALASWAAFAREERAAGRDVYAYFNNDGDAHADAQALRALLEER